MMIDLYRLVCITFFHFNKKRKEITLFLKNTTKKSHKFKTPLNNNDSSLIDNSI